MQSQLKVFSGRANEPLSRRICSLLDIPLGDMRVDNFADGEIRVVINENVRGKDVFVVQPTPPPADNILELLLMIDALRRASAERVTAVIPYFGYARQDRKDKPRVPLSAKLVANLLERAGAGRILTMDLHAEQIQAFFDIPVDHLFSAPILIDYLKTRPVDSLVVVAPDTGRANRARGFARRLGTNVPIAIIDKRRPRPNETEVHNVVGEVSGFDAIIFDDMIDTGSTLLNAADALLRCGARSVSAVATHGVFSGKAVPRILASQLKEVVITDTIQQPPGRENERIRILSVAPLLAEAILRIHRSESVSSLFV
ncbi:MAG: ribose-phosphate pyrophosphokinase [candidate division WOR-3 bacterium]